MKFYHTFIQHEHIMEVKLDEHQRKAVEHFEGPALVVAGPGSGKTTVIIERILHLIRHHNVDPKNILAIAFTNAAADVMIERINKRLGTREEPKIRTLHVFGKDLITDKYAQAGFEEPPTIWNAERIGQTINEEKYRLKKATEDKYVAIYRIEGMKTHRCYIGQTVDPERREKEHRTYSSNRRLREAIQKGDEEFEFKVIRCPLGIYADYVETEEINKRKDLAAVVLEELEDIENESPDNGITIFKIKSRSTVTCYFGLTTDLEQTKELHFSESPNHLLQEAIENEDIDVSLVEVIEEDMSWVDASKRLVEEAQAYKRWAVFNDEDPLNARDSIRRRIEVFCEYFGVPFEEVLEHSQKFGHEMRRFDDLREDIENEKRRVRIGLFEPENIKDPILRAFATKYEKRKTEAKAIDFLDMLILSANMLEKNEDLLAEYHEKFHYVFVDEFQDISPVDFRLIRLFPDNLFAVGDDDQAIYGFRGGDSSIMQKDFHDLGKINEYEISRNYRSTSTIVRHSKALIEYNDPDRIDKDLRSENVSQDEITVRNISRENIKEELLREIDGILSSDFQKVGVIARNWKGEINKIQYLLNCDELRDQGFDIEWEQMGDLLEDETYRKKMCLSYGSKKIDIMNIYKAKGCEWDKVIFLVNTCYPSLPHQENDKNEERRIFYVAVTRAKHELVILNGGDCKFVAQFQELPHSERLKQLDIRRKALVTAFENRVIDAKGRFTKVCQSFLATLKSQRNKPIETTKLREETNDRFRKEYEPEFERLRRKITDNQDKKKRIESSHQLELSNAQDTVVKKLIPIYDKFDSIMNELNEPTEINESHTELSSFYENIQSAQLKFLEVLRNQGLKPIDTIGIPFNLKEHEQKRERVFSNEVPKGNIVRILRQGYRLKGQVIQKAQVVLSKGPEWLDILNPQGSYPLSIITEDRIYTLYAVRIHPDSIRGDEKDGSVVRIKKCDLLFAFRRYNFNTLSIEILSVDPILQRRPFTDEFLESLRKEKVGVNLKTGQVLKGELFSFNRDVLIMSIIKKLVVVFRQGVLGIYTDAELEDVLSVEKCNPNSKLDTSQRSKQKSDRITSSEIDSSKLGKSKKPSVEIGRHLNGIVKNITTFGAFVDLGDIDGLIHKTELTWKKISHPSEVVSVGDEVEVKVIKIDREGKIGLSLKQMKSDPWEEVDQKYPVGSTIQGTVVNVVDYGTFLQLEEGVVGLLHASEMLPSDRGIDWKDKIKVDDEVRVTVLEVLKESKRISLSMKQTPENRLQQLLDKYSSQT